MKKLQHLWMQLAVLMAMAGLAGMVSCSDDDEHEMPIEELNNQISYKSDKTDIRSVVWECSKEGVYTFYLSPREGLKTYEDVMAEKDYLMLQTADVTGNLDGEYRLDYADLELDDKTEYMRSEMEVDFDGNHLDLDFYALTQDRVELNVDYEGLAVKMQPMALKNQWQVNRDAAREVLGAIEWRSADNTEIYLCHEAGVSVPDSLGNTEYLRIKLPNPMPQQVDLATAEGVEVVCGNLDSKLVKVLKGTLTFARNELHKSLSVSLDAVLDDNRLRAEWSGAYAVGYTSANSLQLTGADGKSGQAKLSKVFVNASAATHCVAFGLKEDALTAEELKDRYAVQFNVSNLNQTIDLEKDKNYSLKVFDYANYVTFDAAKEAVKGSLKVSDAAGDKVYFNLDATFANGVRVVAEWFGNLTAVEAFDLTPQKPFRPHFMVTQENGEVTKDLDIMELQVRENPNYQSNVSGATYSAYEFYLVNKYTAGSGVNDAAATPMLVVNKNYIGKKDIDLTQNKTIFDFSYLPFNSTGIASPTEYSGTTEMGSLSISKEGDNWKISFSILDYGNWWGWGGPSGTKAIFSAEWEGPASPYKGK